jgi:hypothetical protein
MNGLITREVPSQRGIHGFLPVVLAAGCFTCGAPRGETVHVLASSAKGFYAEPGWSNPCGHQDTHNTAVAESVSFVGHLLRFPNAQIQAIAQLYIDIAIASYLPEPAVGRTSHRVAGAR